MKTFDASLRSIYSLADFESTLVSTNDESKVDKHIPNSYMHKIVCSFDENLTKEIVEA